MKDFNEIFEDKTKFGTKLKTDEYHQNGKYPIVDQGQNLIAGYTDKEDGVFKELPAIIFGDHTRIIKYIDQPFFIGADGVKILRSKIQDANYKYLYYALKSVKIPNTGYNRHFKWIKASKIIYPDKEIQERVVYILDKLSEIIRIRKKEQNLLDNLIKSRFVELFGDPISNPLGWLEDDMKGICTKITDGEHGSVARSDSGHAFLNAKHIKKDGTIDWKTVTYTNDEIHNKIYARCNPELGDILLTTTGTIGNVAIVPDVAPFSMDRGITLLKLRSDKVKNTFVTTLLGSKGIQDVMSSNVHASAIGHLFLNKVMKIPVIVPPLELQERFSAFVAQTDKSKLLFTRPDLFTQLEKQTYHKA